MKKTEERKDHSFHEEMTMLSCKYLEDHPLRIDYYREQHMRQLLQSIKKDGMITPLVVWKNSSTERYQILMGHYRVRVARRLQMKEVPCRIYRGDEKKALRAYLIANLLSREQSPIEEAYLVEKLIGKGMTMKEIGEIFEHDKSWVSRRLALLKRLNPDMKRLLEKGSLRPRLAQELTRLPQGNNEQERVLALLKKHHMTKDQLAAFIDWWKKASEEERKEAEREKSLPLFQSKTPKQDTLHSLEICYGILIRLNAFLEQQKNLPSWWPMKIWSQLNSSVEKMNKTVLYQKGRNIECGE